MHSLKHQQQRGSVLITVAVAMVVLIAFVGLALDSGTGYLAKAKLSAAVDGAALAAGGAVTHGANWAKQKENAKAAAQAYFNANYPNGTLGTTPTLVAVDVTKSVGRISIKVDASAKGHVSLMRVLGFDPQEVRASAVVGSASLDMALVVDQSQSIAIAGTYPMIQAANTQLVNQLSEDTDRLALVFFSASSKVAIPARANDVGFDKAAALVEINKPLWHPANTNTAVGLNAAVDQLRHQITNPASSQMIFLFTDGDPDDPSAALTAADQARDENITVMTVGLGSKADIHTDFLQCISNSPDADTSCKQPSKPVGAYCRADPADPSSLNNCYDKLMTQALKLVR